MANDTIYSDDYRHENSDGTVTQVRRSIRVNGDRSEIVHLLDSRGANIVVWHVVHSAESRQLHLDEKFRRAGNRIGWPPEGYRSGGA